MNDEMKDLAARMAADEANEGNYAAAAELKNAVIGIAAEDTKAGGTGEVHLIGAPVTDGQESDADAARRFAGQCIELQKRVEELETAERTRLFVEKSLDRLKPQLARRIAEVICPSSPGNEQGAEDALMTAERLVEAGLRFVPTDAETELAQKHLRFIVACTAGQTMLQEWDGMLLDWAAAPMLQADLTDVREQVQRSRRLSGAGMDPENWGVFGLVRVPDEVVFGTEADRG